MTRIYCTLFDSGYLLKGLAMYESLARHSGPFHLYVICCDEECFRILRGFDSPHLTPVSLSEFESSELLAAKKNRSKVEYFWTCSSFSISYCFDRFKAKACTYLDADIYFFSDPTVLLDEIAPNESILLTEHKYTEKYDQTAVSGRYCVQFMTFKNNHDGRKALDWWKARCLEWCYARSEDGKFGDQKYLDDWTERFSGIHVAEHSGCGIAPWNVQQYKISSDHRILNIRKKETDDDAPLIFYHFHRLNLFGMSLADLGSYELSPEVKTEIYRPYISHLRQLNIRLKACGLLPASERIRWNPGRLWRSIKSLIRNHRNVQLVSSGDMP